LALLVLAAARPTAVVTLPTQQQTILLVMDVSISMSAEDVTPDRISASQRAAKKFVAELPYDVRIGVIAYGGTAHLVQRPTFNREDVLAATDGLRLQRATAIGAAIIVALDTIFQEDDIVLPEGSSRGEATKPTPSTPAQEQ
jgi:Ca-activated chloride channel family protein